MLQSFSDRTERRLKTGFGRIPPSWTRSVNVSFSPNPARLDHVRQCRLLADS